MKITFDQIRASLEKLEKPDLEFSMVIGHDAESSKRDQHFGFDPNLFNQNANLQITVFDMDNPKEFVVMSNSGVHRKVFPFTKEGFDKMLASVKRRIKTFDKHRTSN